MKKFIMVVSLAVLVGILGVFTAGASAAQAAGGDIDPALAGWKWFCVMPRHIQKQVRLEMTFVIEMLTDSYMFFGDGTFLYFPYSERFAYYEGTYSASNGKLYLKNANRRHTETDEILTNFTVQREIVMEYEIAADEQGEYLRVGSLQSFRNSAAVDISRADKYKKAEPVDQENVKNIK
ncbi:MAG: hypothetical protein FWG09_07375 [Synergistaceae bacterium]|nr:hypothetical protein [Synergistaceae bacterium]